MRCSYGNACRLRGKGWMPILKVNDQLDTMDNHTVEFRSRLRGLFDPRYTKVVCNTFMLVTVAQIMVAVLVAKLNIVTIYLAITVHNRR